MSGATPPPPGTQFLPVFLSGSLSWLLQPLHSCSMDSSSLSLNRKVAGGRNGGWWPVLPLNKSHGMYLTALLLFILYFRFNVAKVVERSFTQLPRTLAQYYSLYYRPVPILFELIFAALGSNLGFHIRVGRCVSSSSCL